MCKLEVFSCAGTRKQQPGEVTGRNAFLVFAAMTQMERGAKTLAIGIHSGTPYFDCGEDFVKYLQVMADGYTMGRLRILAPFLLWSKADVWAYCKAEGVPVSATYSCEGGDEQPCGSCLSCRDRGSARCTAEHQPLGIGIPGWRWRRPS